MKAALRKRIFYLCRLLGIDEDTRHVLQYDITGKESLTIMGNNEAQKIIEHLETIAIKCGYKLHKPLPKKGQWKNKLPKSKNIYNLMTKEQQRKIIALSMQLYGSFSEEQMNKFCINHFNKPFRRLSANDARKVIEAQKSILRRKL
ncbi:MAG: phage protein GemA/Gp16 family protein [Spirochaetota bacterium]|jgi:hypothetical protein